MNTSIRRLILAAALAVVAASAVAVVSIAKREWANGGVQYLMTSEEAAAWRAIDNDADADDFIARFWARRDPTPGTPRNEYREEIEARVKFADEHFSDGGTRGSLSDRGKMLILFGPPAKVQKSLAPLLRNPADLAVQERDRNREQAWQTWVYEGDSAQRIFGTRYIELKFIDPRGLGDFRFETGRVDVNAARERVLAMSLARPELTSAPVYEAPKPAQAATLAPRPDAGVGEIHTPALLEAVAAKPAASAAQISYAELVTPSGEYFVPIALFVPSSANVVAGNVDTFFGEVRDANGARVASFEEQARPIAAKRGWFVDKTLNLGTGKYTATVGLARDGQAVIVASAPLETTSIAKDAAGISKPILWTEVRALKEPLPMKAPYAFGALQLIPNSTSAFSNQDELGYFVEVNNPGIDAATNQPKLRMSLDLLAEGQPISRQPLSDVQVLALAGTPGPGHYAIVNAIPLSKLTTPLQPGNYSLKMKIVDTVAGQSYTVQENFKIVP